MSQHVEIFPWNANFETGIEVIDSQHQGLVVLLNTLVSHLAYQADAPTIAQVFADLKRYTDEHFSTEARIWRDHLGDDEWVGQHDAEHEDFVAKLAELKLEEGQFSFDEIIEDVVSFLSRWLALHIIDSDKRLAKAVLAIRAGHPVAQAKQHAEHEMTGGARVVIDTVMGMYDKLAARTLQLTREISRRFRAEADLREANEQLVQLRNAALTASQAKSDFLASMAHEIRSPLNAITGLAHLIRRDGLSPHQAQRMDRLVAAGDHLAGIVDAVLDLSKIEAGKMQLDVGPVVPQALLADAAAILQSQADAKGLRLITVLDSIPQGLEGDATRLKQALLNYASNAIKFTAAGSVTLRAQVVQSEPGRVLLRFEVEDTGIGIEPAVLERLFHPFEQADGATSRHFGGTGLGLAITRKLAELMGGSAGARSVPGRGSVFWFTAWLACRDARDDPRREPAERAEDTLRRSFAGTRVLLVDDEPVNREVGLELLTEAGLIVDLAADGEQAIARVRTSAYALILMDMQMPGVDGLAATIRIRSLPSGRTIPIVALTANAFAEDRQRCIEAGMNDFLTKPVDPDLLFEVVLRWLTPAP